ncbi:hypothetical protein [Streptomyces sp. JNUCC 63]
MGRTGPLARPAGLLSFAAATDTALAARVQLTGAETMHDLNETLRALTHGLSWDTLATGPDVALDVTLGRRQELPLHAVGLTRLFENAAGTLGARRTPGEGAASTATEPDSPARCGNRRPGRPERPARERRAPGRLLDGVGRGRRKAPGGFCGCCRRRGAQRREGRAPAFLHRARLLPVGLGARGDHRVDGHRGAERDGPGPACAEADLDRPRRADQAACGVTIAPPRAAHRRNA